MNQATSGVKSVIGRLCHGRAGLRPEVLTTRLLTLT